MGSFCSSNAPLRGQSDIRTNQKIVFTEVLSCLGIDLFKAAIQSCVSASAGVAVEDIHVFELTRSTISGGINVLYSVGNLYEFTCQPEIKGQIDRSVFSGEFTALLSEFGFPSASATRDINAAYIRVDASAESGALVLIINQVSGVFNQLSTFFTAYHGVIFFLSLFSRRRFGTML